MLSHSWLAALRAEPRRAMRARLVVCLVAIAGLAAKNQVSIRNADCAAVSFPGFWGALSELAYAEPAQE